MRSVAAARQRLREAGITPTESDLDARLLAQHVLGWTTERFLTRRRRRGARRLRRRVRRARRPARHPRAARLHRRHREFWGLEFEVTPGRADSAAGDRADRRSVARAVPRPRRAADDRRHLHRHAAASPWLSRTNGRRRPSSPATSRRRRWTWRDATRDRHGVGRRVSFRTGDLLGGSTRSSVRSTRSSRTRRTSWTAPGRRCSRRSATSNPRSRCSAAATASTSSRASSRRRPPEAAARRLSHFRIRPRPGRRDRGAARGARPSSRWSASGAISRASRAPPSRSGP